jgi:hypothetical protein
MGFVQPGVVEILTFDSFGPLKSHGVLRPQNGPSVPVGYLDNRLIVAAMMFTIGLRRTPSLFRIEISYIL